MTAACSSSSSSPMRRIISLFLTTFSPLELRLGGLLQDKVVCGTDDALQLCTPFAKNTLEMHGFTPSCHPLHRWDELNAFFQIPGARIVFGMNALNGWVPLQDGSLGGPWDITNAASLIRFTVSKGYKIHGWDLGNELGGITLLLINLGGGNTTKQVSVTHTSKKHGRKIRHGHGFSQGAGAMREEYHLTPRDGNLQSLVMMLNGRTLITDADGNIPRLEPVKVDAAQHIAVAPHSIVFTHIPHAPAPACSLG